MLRKRTRKVLKVYQDHLANQEAEISQLDSSVSDFRTKFGDLGLDDSHTSQKAELEKNLQKERRSNQNISLAISTREKELKSLQSSLKELNQGLDKMTSENSSADVKGLQDEINSLESKNNELGTLLKEKQSQINDLLSTRKVNN